MERKLSQFHRICIITLKNSGKSWQEISQELLNKYKKAVTKRGMQYLLKKYLETGCILDKKRTGRPPIVSPQSKRSIKRICTRNHLLSVASIASAYNSYTYCNVSNSTVQRILQKYGLRSYTAIKKSYLNLNQRSRRVEWANTFSTWDPIAKQVLY